MAAARAASMKRTTVPDRLVQGRQAQAGQRLGATIDQPNSASWHIGGQANIRGHGFTIPTTRAFMQQLCVRIRSSIAAQQLGQDALFTAST